MNQKLFLGAWLHLHEIQITILYLIQMMNAVDYLKWKLRKQGSNTKLKY